ncbi:hypothetical protein Tco_0524758 [Tanacetum coccineum]
MLAPSGGGLILYQAYGNLYAMTGRKAHLLEDKQIPSVGVFDEVYFSFGRHLEEINVTWAHLEKKRTRLRTYTNMAQEFLYSGWRRRHKYNDAVTTMIKTVSLDSKTAPEHMTQPII